MSGIVEEIVKVGMAGGINLHDMPGERRKVLVAGKSGGNTGREEEASFVPACRWHLTNDRISCRTEGKQKYPE